MDSDSEKTISLWTVTTEIPEQYSLAENTNCDVCSS